MKWSLYLIELLRIFFQIIFLSKQSFVMKKIYLNNNIKQLIQAKNNTYESYFLSDKNPQIFDRVKILQGKLRCLTEGNKEK